MSSSKKSFIEKFIIDPNIKITNHFLIDFTKFWDAHCNSDKYGNFSEESTAKTACAADSNCKGVTDQGCDNRGLFYLCPNTATYQTDQASCIYKKSTPGDGNHINISYY